MCDLDAVLKALADPRRRLSLDCLLRHHAVTLPDLAEYVAERERPESLVDISGEYVRDVYFSLYHNHVPTLEEAGLVRYDQEEDLVVPTEDARSTIETVRESLLSLERNVE